MINILFLALFVFVVDGVRLAGWRSRAFWLLPLLTALWANMHSGYLTGIACSARTSWAKQSSAAWPSRTRRRSPGRKWPARRRDGAFLLAALINPRGLDLVLFRWARWAATPSKQYRGMVFARFSPGLFLVLAG
ncbi:MAG: hypothetical protein H6656_07100 [Ardenticatenaceae bacterium]|nr:hypothetical protein [Ardenticatenaceae bacterium]